MENKEFVFYSDNIVHAIEKAAGALQLAANMAALMRR